MSNRGGPITPENSIAPDWRDRGIAEPEGQRREAQATMVALRAQIVQLRQQIAELERAGNGAEGAMAPSGAKQSNDGDGDAKVADERVYHDVFPAFELAELSAGDGEGRAGW